MNVLLDENITDSAIKYLELYGHNVKSIKGLGLAGKKYSDEKVLETAIKSESILITHNGKDFIESIPPRENIYHFGLIWLNTHMTRVNSKEYCKCIQSVLEESNMINSIWRVVFGQGVKEPICKTDKRYPK